MQLDTHLHPTLYLQNNLFLGLEHSNRALDFFLWLVVRHFNINVLRGNVLCTSSTASHLLVLFILSVEMEILSPLLFRPPILKVTLTIFFLKLSHDSLPRLYLESNFLQVLHHSFHSLFQSTIITLVLGPYSLQRQTISKVWPIAHYLRPSPVAAYRSQNKTQIPSLDQMTACGWLASPSLLDLLLLVREIPWISSS